MKVTAKDQLVTLSDVPISINLYARKTKAIVHQMKNHPQTLKIFLLSPHDSSKLVYHQSSPQRYRMQSVNSTLVLFAVNFNREGII